MRTGKAGGPLKNHKGLRAKGRRRSQSTYEEMER